jgi:hypothetical protein
VDWSQQMRVRMVYYKDKLYRVDNKCVDKTYIVVDNNIGKFVDKNRRTSPFVLHRLPIR